MRLYILAADYPEAARIARRLELRRHEWLPLVNGRELAGVLAPLVLVEAGWDQAPRRYGVVDELDDALDRARARRLVPDEQAAGGWALAFAVELARLHSTGALSVAELDRLVVCAESASK